VWAEWLPTMWFLGLYEVVQGKATGSMGMLAGRALIAMGIAIVLAGVAYAGCDARGSDLTFDKWRTRQAVSAVGVQVAPGRNFLASAKPTAAALAAELGEQVVAKANPPGRRSRL